MYGSKVRRFTGLMVCLLLSVNYMASVNAQERNLRFTSSDEPGSLIELYTSQGCSSCPPAERWISKFKHDKRLWKSLFPLAFHVDYWDYIGWKDEFAKAQYGNRQRLYQRLGLISQVATPGFIVSGKGWNGWFRGQRLPQVQRVEGLGGLQIDIDGREVLIRYTTKIEAEQDKSFKINIALLGFDMLSNINAGENRGRNLQQDFVVLSLHHEFLLSKKDTASRQELWSSRLRLPESVDRLGVEMALLGWTTKGGELNPLQVTGGWL